MGSDPSKQLLEIEVRTENEMPIVVLRGEADVSNAQALRAQLDRVPVSQGAVIDMQALEFLDSTALGAIVAFGKRLKDSGGELHLVITHPAIRRLFEITNLDTIFPIVERLDAVLEAYDRT